MKDKIIKALLDGMDRDELCEIGIHQICYCAGRQECHNCYQPYPKEPLEALKDYLDNN